VNFVISLDGFLSYRNKIAIILIWGKGLPLKKSTGRLHPDELGINVFIELVLFDMI